MRHFSLVLMAALLLEASAAEAQRSAELVGADVPAIVEVAVRAILADSSGFAGAIPRDQPLHLDSTTTNTNMREAGVGARIAFDGTLDDGRRITVAPRASLLDCPTPAISSRCAFRRPGTSIWLGAPRRTGDEIAVIVHVMRPAPTSPRIPSRIAGFSVEVVLRKRPDGMWTAARFGKVVAG
jgi:hypothetical protein